MVFVDAEREAYEPYQVYETMTVGELAEMFAVLAECEGADAKVYLRHDNGYTYGGITEMRVEIG